MSVAAIDANKQVANFSQYNNQVEIAAPGVAVLSTTPWQSTAEVRIGATIHKGHAVELAAHGLAAGELVYGGLCDASGSWTGKVVLCARGSISFYDKVLNAQNGGAVAALIYNNEPGELFATLGEGNSSSIPALGFSDVAGTALRLAAGSTVDVESTRVFPASGYEAWDGTSMATPHVAGVAALVWSHNASWSAAQVRSALNASAEDLGAAGRDTLYGYGLVRAAAALAYLGGSSPPPSNVAPVASFTASCTGLICTFNATASSDPDGTIESYAWSFGGSGAITDHTFASGSHTVTLTVIDNKGAASSTSKTVTVSAPGQGTLEISNVASAKGKGIAFSITWTTNLPSTSVVTLTGSGSFTNTTLVTNHAMSFTGSKNTTYTYTVQSTDASGATVTAGPFIHQN
jgi:PKD repeat protein